jgi:hypothetical protein
VFVITTDLGDFESMRDGTFRDQLAAVIEARSGPLRGTVLQHPLLDQQARKGKSLAGKRYQVSPEVLDRLLAGGDVDYRDPMAKAEGGSLYGGTWLAAVAPVTLPRELDGIGRPADGGAAETTDLMVLVQYRLAKVFEPVGDLQRQLLIEGTVTLGVLFSLALGMWWYVNRLTDASPADEPPRRTGPSNPAEAPTVEVR